MWRSGCGAPASDGCWSPQQRASPRLRVSPPSNGPRLLPIRQHESYTSRVARARLIESTLTKDAAYRGANDAAFRNRLPQIAVLYGPPPSRPTSTAVTAAIVHWSTVYLHLAVSRRALSARPSPMISLPMSRLWVGNISR